jgi:hypothetical protein
MNFGDALQFLKLGQKVARYGWINTERFICYKTEMDCIITGSKAGVCLIPWLASQTDILAEDWIIVG